MDRPECAGRLGARRRARPRASRAARQKVDTENDERDELKIARARRTSTSASSPPVRRSRCSANLERADARVLYADELAIPDARRARRDAQGLGAPKRRRRSVSRRSRERLSPRRCRTSPAFPAPSRRRRRSCSGTRPCRRPRPTGCSRRWRASTKPPSTASVRATSARTIWAMDLMAPIEASHLSQAQGDDAQADGGLLGAPARQRGLLDLPRAQARASSCSPTPSERKQARQGQRRHPSDHEPRRRAARLRPLPRYAGATSCTRATTRSLGMRRDLGRLRADAHLPRVHACGRRLWNTWLPDIFLNPHGYPSHQLVQLFSEYTGLVRRGRITERNWSMNKGWFMPGFGYTDDPRFPRHKDAAFEIRDYITEAINASPGRLRHEPAELRSLPSLRRAPSTTTRCSSFPW